MTLLLDDRAEFSPAGTVPIVSSSAAPFFLIIWLALIFFGRSSLLQDPGTFWHIALGERFLSTGEFCRQDTFTFTRHGETWLSVQWLAEAAMAGAYRLGGWDSLLLLTCTVLAGIYTWLASRLMRAGLHWLPTAVVVAVVIAASSHHFHARPHLATIGCLGLTTAWLCDVGSGRRPLGWLFWLAPLFALWTNLHGGVLGGVVTLAAAIAGWLIQWVFAHRRPIRTRAAAMRLAAIGIAAVLSLIINPYGLAMIDAWLRIMTMPLPELIQEHRPLSLRQPESLMVIALALMYGALLWDAVRRRGARRTRITWLLPALWLILATQRVRHAPLFAIVAAVVMADLLPHTRLAAWLKQWELLGPRTKPERYGNARFRQWGLGLGLVGLLLGCAAAAPFRPPIYSPNDTIVGTLWARLDNSRWPVDLLPELRNIEREQPETRLINTLDFGGFLTFHTPGLKTLIDDRCELFGTQFLSEYAQAELHQPQRLEAWADEYGVSWALVRAGTPMDRHLRSSPRWKVVRESSAASLYSRCAAGHPPERTTHRPIAHWEWSR